MKQTASFLVICSLLLTGSAFASDKCDPKETNCWSCGDDCTARLDSKTGKFTVSGTGDMDNYTPKKRAPWFNALSSISDVIILTGITSVGDFAFEGRENTNIKSIYIGNTVKSIGEAAFFRTYSVSEITLPESLEAIKNQAFEGNRPLKSFIIPPKANFSLDPNPKLSPFHDWKNLSILYCPERLERKCNGAMRVIENNTTEVKTYKQEGNMYIVGKDNNNLRYNSFSEMQNQK